MAAVSAVAIASFLLRPVPPIPLESVTQQPVLWRGAYHVHSTISDGSGTPEGIAAAAAAAGLDFVILTDHGDATRPPAPPRVEHGVLLIDAVEISTDDGHYVALDLPQSPYRLAGEGRAVADDVRRLGGLGILAHPDSPRAALAWRDPSTDADGFEWINADTMWRTARIPSLAARLLTYPFNASGTLAALARYPAALLAERDSPSRRPQLALAAVDAHARVGWQRDEDESTDGRTLAALPSYESSFGTLGVMVPWLDGAPSGQPDRDATRVLHAIRHRLAYSAVFSMASTAWISLELIEPPATAQPGPDATGAATLLVRTNAPAEATVRLLRNGVPLRDVPQAEWSTALDAGESAAIYRAEMWLPARRGWPPLPVAVSAARGHNVPASAASPAPDAMTGVGIGLPQRSASSAEDDVGILGWHVEHDPASRARVDPASAGSLANAVLALAPGARVSQFAALVADLAPIPPDATALVLYLSASKPMRLSIQLRDPAQGEGRRWRHSAFIDATARTVVLPLDHFRAIAPAAGPVPLERLHALLLVTDTVNGRPGDERRVTVHRASWLRGR